MTPEPSAALLALQLQGLELTEERSNAPTSPRPVVEYMQDAATRSELNTPGQHVAASQVGMQRSESVYSQYPDALEKRTTRRVSGCSVETTVSNIIRLYAGLSRQSSRLEFEDVNHQGLEEAHLSSVPTVHEPKAYHDTVAPLLQNQFFDYDIPVAPIPSPLSLASSSALHVSQMTNPAIPSPPISPMMYPMYLRTTNTSHSSIQITPDTSPLIQPSNTKDLSEQASDHEPWKRAINLEVPDVREADSWYDQPLSPLSPTATIRTTEATRETHISTVSDDSTDLQKTPLYSEFPPLVREDGVVPLPLDLSRSKTMHENTQNTQNTSPAHVPHLKNSGDLQRFSQKAQIASDQPRRDSSAGSIVGGYGLIQHNGSTTGSPNLAAYLSGDEHQMKEPQRSTSAFSSSSSEPAVDVHRGRPGFATKFRNKFLKKDKQTHDGSQSPGLKASFSRNVVTATCPTRTPTRSKFSLHLGSMVTDSGLTSRSVSHLDLTGTSDNMNGLELGPVITAFDLQRIEHYQPPPMHDQSHEAESAVSTNERPPKAPENCAGKDEQRERELDGNREPQENELRARHELNQVEQVTRRIDEHALKHSSAKSFDQQIYNHNHRISTTSSARYSNGPKSPRVIYNNVLFEASGGVPEKKRNTIGKMFRSAEEKRKDKLKESIMIIGSGRLDNAVGRAI